MAWRMSTPGSRGRPRRARSTSPRPVPLQPPPRPGRAAGSLAPRPHAALAGPVTAAVACGGPVYVDAATTVAVGLAVRDDEIATGGPHAVAAVADRDHAVDPPCGDPCADAGSAVRGRVRPLHAVPPAGDRQPI